MALQTRAPKNRYATGPTPSGPADALDPMLDKGVGVDRLAEAAGAEPLATHDPEGRSMAQYPLVDDRDGKVLAKRGTAG